MRVLVQGIEYEVNVGDLWECTKIPARCVIIEFMPADPNWPEEGLRAKLLWLTSIYNDSCHTYPHSLTRWLRDHDFRCLVSLDQK